MKLFWMKFEVGEYLSKTSHLSTVEHGAYLLLLLHYWMNGGLPNDEESIFRITRMEAKQWKKSRGALKTLFDEDWRHAELDEKRAQAIEKSQVNSANARRSHARRSKIAAEFAEGSHNKPESDEEAEPQLELQQQRASASQQQLAQLPDAALSYPVRFENGVQVHELADYLCDIAGLPLTEGEKVIVREWCAKNWDPRLICHVVKGVLGRSSSNAPRTLKYFEPAIQDVYSRFGPTDPVEKPLN